MSLPLRERGLKFLQHLPFIGQTFVAPLAGAWIEMDYVAARAIQAAESLPLRERGLKCISAIPLASAPPSLPLRERGLKSAKQCPCLYPLCRSPCGSVD